MYLQVGYWHVQIKLVWVYEKKRDKREKKYGSIDMSEAKESTL